MSKRISPRRPDPFLSVRIGAWFEARAGGWGVAVLPLVVLAVVAAGLAQALL